MPKIPPDSLASRSTVRDLHPADRHVGADGEIRPAPGGGEVGDGGAHPQAVADVAWCRSDAEGAWSVVVRDVSVPDLDRGLDERLLDRAAFVDRVAADRDRTVVPVPLVREVQIGLQPPEERQDLGEAPSGVAQRAPLVVVGRRAAQREAAVGG